MPSYSDDVRDLVLGSLWSMWAEFGVSGWERHHHDSALDLEALIVTTARLGHRDARPVSYTHLTLPTICSV